MEKFKSNYKVYDKDGKEVTNCFVLRPDIDEVALTALKTYAGETNNDELSYFLNCWIDDLEWNFAQEYIGEDI
jgi:hypothetical protein